ncbi:sensor histidine kinase [Bacillus sp. MRMR6]|uniref:sensor histidine kinase n=1 Tax=Bacillus sp. MRMR6 TaxID=1928617 RepID=UPI000952EA8F|nr:sensor histidine kinase [Bacillus sp. MRMR6]OLS33642.1 two-component sensor histidine kinase [Bacillus sp. MRMR6]
MSIVARQVFWSIGFATIIALAIATAFIIVFPLASWSELWNQQLMDIPFVIFIPSFSIALGILLGIFSGVFWRRQFQEVEFSLSQLEQGRQAGAAEKKAAITEMLGINERVNRIAKQMSEQAKLSQRLATEKVEDQEARIQEIISQERNRLARELHDSVSQQLFAASMMMSAINETKQHTEESVEGRQLKIVEEMIHQSQLEMRALLLHLRPVALKNKTLKEGMEELLIELSQKVTMEIKWKVEDFPLDKGVEDHLFRILQESVSNTLRHSKATTLEVLLVKRDHFAILRIVDDGVGFEVEGRKAGSYGMQNMYERAGEVGGTLKVISVKDKGTRLEVKVPVTFNGDGGND